MMHAIPRQRAVLSYAVAVLLVAGLPVVAQEAADPSSETGPRAVIEAPLADVGEVSRGERVTHDFIISNEGDAPLEITEVRPSCGCTVAEYDEVIPPGETGKIHAELDTSGVSGAAAKGITVFTNDPDKPRLQLTLRVRTVEHLYFNPGFARFVKGHGHSPGTVKQVFYSPDFEDLEIEEVESPYPFLEVAYHEAGEGERWADVEGRQYVFTLTLDYSQAPVGPVAGNVLVRTNHPKQPEAQLPVSGFVRPLLAVTPPIADFGSVSLEEPLPARFLVKNFGEKEVKITRIEQSLPEAEVSFEPLEEGRSYQVEMVLKPEMPKGPFVSELKIHTDSPEEPVVTVPVRGEVQ